MASGRKLPLFTCRQMSGQPLVPVNAAPRRLVGPEEAQGRSDRGWAPGLPLALQRPSGTTLSRRYLGVTKLAYRVVDATHWQAGPCCDTTPRSYVSTGCGIDSIE